MKDGFGWEFTGEIRPSDQEFSRYAASLEMWANRHADAGWLHTPEGRDHEEFLTWFELTFSGGVE